MITDQEFPRWARWMLILLVGVGLWFRFLHVNQGRWAWLDEALVGYQVFERSFLTLAIHKGFQQVAPVAYMWSLKFLAVVTGSYREWVFRIPALIAGVGGLLVTAGLARRIFSPWAALAAVGLFSLSPKLIYYSWEIKPYAVEAAMVPLLLAFAAAGPGTGWRRPLPRSLGIAALAPWFALTSVFFLPGLLVDAWHQDQERRSPWVKKMAGVLALSAVLCVIWILLLGGGGRGHLYNFWQGHLAPLKEGPVAVGGWLFGRVRGLMEFVIGVGKMWPLAVGLFGLGLVRLYRRRSRLFLLLGAPVALWLLAATLNLYPAPFSPNFRVNRLSVHAIPLAILIISAGVAALENSRARSLAPVLTIFLLFAAGSRIPAVQGDEVYLEVGVSYILENYREGDFVGLTHSAFETWRYYAASDLVTGGPARTFFLAGRYNGIDDIGPSVVPPGATRIWWFGPAKPAHDLRNFVPGLHTDFVRVVEERAPPHLELWVRREPSARRGH